MFINSCLVYCSSKYSWEPLNCPAMIEAIKAYRKIKEWRKRKAEEDGSNRKKKKIAEVNKEPRSTLSSKSN